MTVAYRPLDIACEALLPVSVRHGHGLPASGWRIGWWVESLLDAQCGDPKLDYRLLVDDSSDAGVGMAERTA